MRTGTRRCAPAAWEPDGGMLNVFTTSAFLLAGTGKPRFFKFIEPEQRIALGEEKTYHGFVI